MKGHQWDKKRPLCLRDLSTCFGILFPIIDTVGSTILFSRRGYSAGSTYTS